MKGIENIIVNLNQWQKALNNFKIAIIKNPSEIERDGAIQRFEYNFELAWKTLKTVLEYLGVEDCKSPRKALQSALINNYISTDDEWIWVKMMEDRNRVAHTYNEHTAEELYAEFPIYYEKMELVLKNLINEFKK